MKSEKKSPPYPVQGPAPIQSVQWPRPRTFSPQLDGEARTPSVNDARLPHGSGGMSSAADALRARKELLEAELAKTEKNVSVLLSRFRP